MPETTLVATTAFLVATYAAALVVAAVWDAWKFRIPNILPAALLVAFVPAALVGPQPVEWTWHLGMGVAVFLVGALLFARGLLGGGDVKLAAACALWMGPTLPTFLVFMMILGGAITVVLLALRYGLMVAKLYVPQLQEMPLPKILTCGEGVPYGIAIAGAGLWMAPRLPLLAG